MLLKPPPLRRGDRVRIVAPSGPFDRESFEVGLKALAARYEPVYDSGDGDGGGGANGDGKAAGIFSRARYLAGDDDRRLAELLAALADPSTRAVFCARGGYGAMRLLRRLDQDGGAGGSLRDLPLKPLIGFSDITALHQLWQAHGRVSIHGPVLTQLGRQPAASLVRLFRLLESSEPAEPLAGARTIVPGSVEGPLLGGNLSVLTRLLGTPYLPSFRGAVLLLEDVGERPYRLDRMWQHLLLAGVLDQVAGIAFGDFTGCEEPDPAATYTCADVLDSLARELGKPCVAGFSVGHGALNLPVPLGCRVRLDATATESALHFLEPAVQGSGTAGRV